MKGMGSDPVRDVFFRKIIRLLQSADIPFMVGGGYAFAVYTDVRRDTKDLDMFIKPEHCAPALELAKKAGFKTWIKSPHWLGKIQNGERGEHFVDLIYSSGNATCPVDDRWFEHSVEVKLLGTKIKLTPPEEMIWSKGFIMERHRYDGADVAHLILAKGHELDWERLIDRFAEKWPVLLSHLLLFRFIYPQKAEQVPDRVLTTLLDRLPQTAAQAAQKDQDPLCRGTLLSFQEYLPDIQHWGYRDARLKPLGALSQRQIDRWTEEPK